MRVIQLIKGLKRTLLACMRAKFSVLPLRFFFEGVASPVPLSNAKRIVCECERVCDKDLGAKSESAHSIYDERLLFCVAMSLCNFPSAFNLISERKHFLKDERRR